MDTSKLSQFMSSGLITLIAFGVIILILKHWKEAAWLKIGSVIVIALILNYLNLKIIILFLNNSFFSHKTSTIFFIYIFIK